MAKEGGAALPGLEQGHVEPGDGERDSGESPARPDVDQPVSGLEDRGSEGRFEGVPREVFPREAPEEVGRFVPGEKLREVGRELAALPADRSSPRSGARRERIESKASGTFRHGRPV
jgi:hypothetical protein